MAEREPFTFTGSNDDYGILATDKLAATDVVNFLNDTDPEEVMSIKDKDKEKKDPKKTQTPAQKQQNPPPKTKQAKPAPQEETEEEEEEETPKKPTNEEILNLLSAEESEEEEEEPVDEEEEEEEETPSEPKKPGPANKKKQEEGKVKGEEEEQEEEDENEFASMSKDLIKLGVFTVDEDEDEESAIATTPEELAQRFILEKRKGAIEIVDNFLSSKGEAHREFFDAIMVNGVDPKDYLEKYVQIESIKGLDLTKPEDQEKIVRENLKRQGYPSDSIDNKIRRMVEYGEIEEEAKLAQGILLKKEEEDQRSLIEKKRQEVAQKQQQKAHFVNNVSKVLTEKVREKAFDGIPVDIKTANKVGHFLTADKYEAGDGKTLTEFDKYILDLNRPENHAQKVKLALLINLLQEDPTLSRIQKKAVSKESSELFQKLRKDKDNTKKSSSSGKSQKKGENEEVKSWF